MNRNGHRLARGLVAGVLTVPVLPIVLWSQTPPQGQPPPPPPAFVTVREGTTTEQIVGVGSRVMSGMRVSIPADNASSEARVELGRRLFSDPVLSRDRTVSCSTCHKPEFAFTDQKPLAVGIAGRVGKRHSPTLVNRGLGHVQFWDGRAATLEELALMPLRDVNEMDLPPEEAVARLNADAAYKAAFQAAYGGPATTDDLARAIAGFVRMIRSENSPYDRFVAGDQTALSAEQQRGLQVFRTRGQCTFCHREPTFSDEVFQNTGVAWKPNTEGVGGEYLDDGRFAVSKFDRDKGKFKTPTLREIARTAPYMHDGSLATLDDVVDFYDKGGRRNPNLFPIIRPIGLSVADKTALVKFLESLSGDVTTTVLGRERTSPDFSGAWIPVPGSAAALNGAPLWNAEKVTIVQNQALITTTFSNTAGTQLVRRAYGLDGTIRRTIDRSLAPGKQQLSTRAAWQDWQLSLVTVEPGFTADGTSTTEEVTQVLALDSASMLTVKVSRAGTKNESWTFKLQRSR